MVGLIHKLYELVWGPWLLIFFLFTGILYTVRFRLFQIRKIKYWLSMTVGNLWKGRDSRDEKREVSQFATACTALAATVGTGNIVGVATAVTAGGAGALFWMWVSALIGMMTAYGEVSLGIRYRYRNKKGQMVCGPMSYLERGLGCRWLALVYAFLCCMASLGMGSMVQANSISESLRFSSSLPPVWIAILLTVLVAVVILGGVKRISTVASSLVPLSAGFYTVASLIIIMAFYDRLPGVFAQIFREAVTPSAVLGGTAGYGISKSLQYGMARGVFSNEAGLGSLSILHGEAEQTTQEEQGMWAMFEVFFDTIISCTLTGLVILCVTGGNPVETALDGGALTAFCFAQCFGSFGGYLVGAAMTFFAFATIVAWFYLGRQAVCYLTESNLLRNFYMVCYLAAVFVGCIGKLQTVWELSDIFNGLMAVPNLAALLILVGKVKSPLKTSPRHEKTSL